MISCTCTGARLVAGHGGSLSSGGAYTLYQMSVETSSGATFEVNKRFSDFEALHDAYILPVRPYRGRPTLQLAPLSLMCHKYAL